MIGQEIPEITRVWALSGQLQEKNLWETEKVKEHLNSATAFGAVLMDRMGSDKIQVTMERTDAEQNTYSAERYEIRMNELRNQWQQDQMRLQMLG